jgi:redox-sensing transcriptional repressor
VTVQVGDVRDGVRSRPNSTRPIPEATVARLTVYLRVLDALVGEPAGPTLPATTISSGELARRAGVNPAKLRKDLSFLGPCGIRGVGYDVVGLTAAVESALGVDRVLPVALVGVGNLGQALAGYAGFHTRQFPLTALFDSDPAKVGCRFGDLVVQDVGAVAEVCRQLGIAIGVVAVPVVAAQAAADALVAAGVRSVLNFAPLVLQVPDSVQVRRVDLGSELQVLALHHQERPAAGEPVSARR